MHSGFSLFRFEVKLQKPPEGSVHSLDRILAENIAKFFVVYNDLQGRKFKVLQIAGPDRAMELIREGVAKARASKKRTRSASA